MSRRQQRTRKKHSDQVKIGLSSTVHCNGSKSVEEFLSTNIHDHSALFVFHGNFGMFLRKYKDESNQIIIRLKHEQRLNFAMIIARVLLDDKQIGPKLAMIGEHFSSQADPNYKWVDDLLEGFDEAETLISYLKDLFNKDQTVLDYLNNLYRMNQVNFHTNARRALKGSIVTTRHNDWRHTIHDIDFDRTPSSSGGEVSHVEYFKRQYDIDIKDLTQPLLVCMEKFEDEDLPICLIPELTFMAEATAADLRVKKGPNLAEMKELVASVYRWVIEKLDLDFAEYQGFREGLHEKERQKWDELVFLYTDKFNEFEYGDLSGDELAVTNRELVNMQKEIEDMIARFKNQNRNLDIAIDFIEGNSLDSVPKQEKEKCAKRKKKRKNTDAKYKDGNANADGESLIQGDITEAPYQEEESGHKALNIRKKPDTKNKDAETNNNGLIEESVFKEFAEIELADSIETQQFKSDSDSINIVVLKEKVMLNVKKAQVDESKNGLRAEPLKNFQINFELTSSHQTSYQLREGHSNNSQLNFNLTSANQEVDLSSEPLKEIPVRDPNEVREEVRDKYIKDIVEVNEKVENMKQQMIENDEIKARELKDLKTKQDQEKLTLDEESGREKWEVKEEMSRVKKRMAETEAKWDRKKQEMCARHTEENAAVRKKYTDQESQKTLANLKKASAQLSDDMKKLDIDSNVVKQVDDAREMLECPICMEMMSPPTRIWMCEGNHCVSSLAICAPPADLTKSV